MRGHYSYISLERKKFHQTSRGTTSSLAKKSMEITSNQSRRELKAQIQLEQSKGGKEIKVGSDLKGGSAILKKERRNMYSYFTPQIATSKISTHRWTSQTKTTKIKYQEMENKVKERKEEELSFSSKCSCAYCIKWRKGGARRNQTHRRRRRS